MNWYEKGKRNNIAIRIRENGWNWSGLFSVENVNDFVLKTDKMNDLAYRRTHDKEWKSAIPVHDHRGSFRFTLIRILLVDKDFRVVTPRVTGKQTEHLRDCFGYEEIATAVPYRK